MNLLQEEKYKVPSWNFVKKNVLCEKGDEITRFDGMVQRSSDVCIVVPSVHSSSEGCFVAQKGAA